LTKVGGETVKYLNKLFEIDDAFCDTQECNDIFFNAVREAFEFHYRNSEIYRNICDQENFRFDSIGSIDELYKLPHIIVDAFKWHDILSIDRSKIVSTFTSSGTSGQKSHISWDEGSKNRQTIMREKIMRTYGLVSEKKVNYMIFAYSPAVSEGKGAAYAHQMYSTFAPANKKVFAIDADENGKAKFFKERTINTLVEFEKEGLPVRIIGFPAFIYETLLEMQKLNIKVKFKDESLIIIAGGWKTAEKKSIPFDEFSSLTAEFFGIGASRIRDVYGFVEHGVPYVTCSHQHFHIPIYSKAFVRKPGTLEVLKEGEKGLLQVISPYNYAQPTLSILSTDYAIIRSGCECGITRQYIELKGRAGLKKHEGCAISATELLKAQKR
jgi:phenylacetate-coenzyme A ligase PaaK-like adenylate-forming protein